MSISNSEPGKIFGYSISVSEEHIDDLNHVNNVIYVQWVNDIAQNHWKSVSTPEMNNKYVWFLVNHEITYKDQAHLGDTIEISTFFHETNPVKSKRVVEFHIQEKLIARSVTTWCLIDAHSRKVVRITGDIKALIEKYLVR